MQQFCPVCEHDTEQRLIAQVYNCNVCGEDYEVNKRFVRGGNGSHWEGCEETHWDCKIAKLEKQLAAERENADGLAKALQIAVDELCGQLHGPVSAVFEGAFDALQQHEQIRKQEG